MDFKKEIEEMREKFMQKPLKRIKLPRPAWLTEYDGLSSIFTEKETLISEGSICYGCIVQANELLFKRFPNYDCPAEVIYSENPEIDEEPGILFGLAREIYSYKNKPLDEVPAGLRELVRVTTDEYDRSSFCGTISDDDGNKLNFGLTSLMIFRKHIPKHKLCGSVIPIIAAPGKCCSVMVLPQEYWSEEFKKAWTKKLI